MKVLDQYYCLELFVSTTLGYVPCWNNRLFRKKSLSYSKSLNSCNYVATMYTINIYLSKATNFTNANR